MDTLAQMIRILDIDVRQKLFQGLKFITREEVLYYSTDPNTICGFVCKELRIKAEN